MTQIYGALVALRKGDSSAKLPLHGSPGFGRVAEVFNDLVEQNVAMAEELQRLAQMVGKEGKLRRRASLQGARGFWAQKVESINSLIDDLVHTRAMAGEQMARATAEVARLAAEETTRRSNFLARASHELGASLDLEQGMRRLLDLVVPQMADTAALVVGAEPETPLIFSKKERIESVPVYGELPQELREALQRVYARGCRSRARPYAIRCASASARSGRSRSEALASSRRATW